MPASRAILVNSVYSLTAAAIDSPRAGSVRTGTPDLLCKRHEPGKPPAPSSLSTLPKPEFTAIAVSPEAIEQLPLQPTRPVAPSPFQKDSRAPTPLNGSQVDITKSHAGNGFQCLLERLVGKSE